MPSVNANMNVKAKAAAAAKSTPVTVYINSPNVKKTNTSSSPATLKYLLHQERVKIVAG